MLCELWVAQHNTDSCSVLDRGCPLQNESGISVTRKMFTSLLLVVDTKLCGVRKPTLPRAQWSLKPCLKKDCTMTGNCPDPWSMCLFLGLFCFQNILKSLHQNETKCQNLRIFHETESLFPGQPYYWTLIWYNMCPYLHTWSTALTHV